MTDSEMDALSQASRNVQNKTGEQNLWKAVMTLPSWYFLAQGSGDDVEPLVSRLGGRPSLVAFTSEDRAEAFARHLAAKQGGSRREVLNMDITDAVGYCQQVFDLGVETIHFNSGDYEFGCEMVRLRDMLGRYAS